MVSCLPTRQRTVEQLLPPIDLALFSPLFFHCFPGTGAELPFFNGLFFFDS